MIHQKNWSCFSACLSELVDTLLFRSDNLTFQSAVEAKLQLDNITFNSAISCCERSQHWQQATSNMKLTDDAGCGWHPLIA